MDLVAYIKKKITINPSETAIIPTGIAVAIPKNYEIQIRPRSGLAAKKGITVLNTPGTIDADYRGEIKIILINLSTKSFVVKSGDRIAQMILCPVAKGRLKEVKNLPKTIRGKEGFGSTGK
jgi:dUTP pyrophosphatase